MNGNEIPMALVHAAHSSILMLDQRLMLHELRIEITFTPDALNAIAMQRPAVLKLERLSGVDVFFPERAVQQGGRWDWEIYVSGGDEWRRQFGTLEALLDT